MQLTKLSLPDPLQKIVSRVGGVTAWKKRRFWLINIGLFLLLISVSVSIQPLLTSANPAAACQTSQTKTGTGTTKTSSKTTKSKTTVQGQLPLFMTPIAQNQSASTATVSSVQSTSVALNPRNQPMPKATHQRKKATATPDQATPTATAADQTTQATATTSTDQVSPTSTPDVSASSSTVSAMILDMLHNMQQNGFDTNACINNGLGGLWINWRYGTTPLQVNLNGSGNPDGSGVKLRHDELTDLRYVHALWMYKNQNPGDTQFDSELTRYTAIVKYEFQNTHNERGWVYDELIDLYTLSHDDFYRQTASSLAQYYFTAFYDAKAGIIYKATSASGANGTGSGAAGSAQPQRVDLALEIGCALMQAGVMFNQPTWKQAGQRAIQQLYATAYLPQYHEFVYLITNVLLADGTANPNPSIYNGMSASLGYNLVGGQVRMGAVAQEILSLLHVYSATRDTAYLKDATDLLDPFTIQNNTLGLWDTQQQGYFNAAVFPGPDVQHAGTPKISGNTKESGRQLQMLEAFRVANIYTNNRYQSMQDALLQVATRHAYYPAGHGVVYEVAANWQILVRNGKPFDWVTTEAMGIAFEGFFSLSRTNPW